MQQLLAIAAAPCAVSVAGMVGSLWQKGWVQHAQIAVSVAGMVSSLWQKGWVQHAQITLRCDESSYGAWKLPESPNPSLDS